jgi:hypothetical protein
MAFIPENANWYLAQIVLEITVQGEAQNVIHINYLLIEAGSPEEAYAKALHLGKQHETTYPNPKKQEVNIHFRGLRNLNVIYKALEDGAEILYEQRIGVDSDEISEMIRPKEMLAVFQPMQAGSGPDYASEEVVREARTLMESGGQHHPHR